MNLKIEIRQNVTKEIATDVWKDWEFNEFWWEAGNAACDCNRSLFFYRARNEPEPDGVECGMEKYSVRLSDADTGEILYDELDDTENDHDDHV